MKKILSLLMLTACILAACTSVDDTLKPSDDIYVSVLETQDTVRVIPGDTVHFHFMVSTNNGAITRIEFVSDESIIEGHPEKMTFSLIDTTMVLTADTEGYLSREVSSLIVDYPCYVKSNPAILGNTQQITFRATNKQGNRGENYIRFRGYNTKKYSTRVTILDNYSAKGKSRFFSLPNYRAYTENSFLREDTVIDGAEEIKQNISLVFRYNSSGDYHMYSPANPELQTYLESIGITGYNAGEILSVSLDQKEADWKRAYEKEALPWLDGSNLKGWDDPIPSKYAVRGIPYQVLIGQDGKFVGLGFHSQEELKSTIENYLNTH